MLEPLWKKYIQGGGGGGQVGIEPIDLLIS